MVFSDATGHSPFILTSLGYCIEGKRESASAPRHRKQKNTCPLQDINNVQPPRIVTIRRPVNSINVWWPTARHSFPAIRSVRNILNVGRRDGDARHRQRHVRTDNAFELPQGGTIRPIPRGHRTSTPADSSGSRAFQESSNLYPRSTSKRCQG